MLIWAVEHVCECNEDICALAAQGRHLEILQLAREHDWPCPDLDNADAKLFAETYGLGEHNMGNPLNNGALCELAAQNGHLETLSRLREHDCPCPDSDHLFAHAAVNGHIEIMTWLCEEQGCQLEDYMCEATAEYGQLKVLMWMRKHGCPAGAYTRSVFSST